MTDKDLLKMQELQKENNNLKKIIQTNRIYTLDEQIDQYFSLSKIHMTRIIKELRLEEYNPKNQERIKNLMIFFESLKEDVKKLTYPLDTIHSLDIEGTFLKGWLKMKTVSFINFKGGVGKTTICFNTAYAISHCLRTANVKVLFIDNDKQGNASNWFKADLSKGTITNIMMGDASAKEIIQHTKYPNIDLIPSDTGLIEANSALIKKEDINQGTILKNSLKEIANKYHICIVDNPPDINVSVLNSLAITDDIVIVTFPDPDSLSGTYKMVDQINMVKPLNSKINFKGVLINAFTSDDSTYAAIDDIKNHNLPLFDTHIHYATKQAKKYLNLARLNNQSIFEQSESCLVARDIWKFTKELLGIKER